MFCPQCKKEYPEGLSRCTDCGTDLVCSISPQEKPPQPRLIHWVTVLESYDAGVIMVAKSILEGAGINCFVVGENLQNLFGLGKIAFNPLINTIKLQVDQEDAEVAGILLDEFKKSDV